MFPRFSFRSILIDKAAALSYNVSTIKRFCQEISKKK